MECQRENEHAVMFAPRLDCVSAALMILLLSFTRMYAVCVLPNFVFTSLTTCSSFAKSVLLLYPGTLIPQRLNRDKIDAFVILLKFKDQSFVIYHG